MIDVRNQLFWQRCDALIEERRTNRSAVSKFAFMSRNAYKSAREKQSTPGIDFADGMARALDVSVEFLICGTREGEPYIPREVPEPANPDAIIKQAKGMASIMYPSAVTLVLSQKPDLRMGVARLVELFCRADKMLADEEKRAATKKRKTKRAPRASR